MNICIALLRGINVGGKNSLPMKGLVAIMEVIGAQKVRTYIQSGNAVFEIAEQDLVLLSKRLSVEIGKRYEFKTCVVVLGLEALEKAMAANPFPEAEGDPVGLHLGFLASDPTHANLEKLDSLRKASERFRLIGPVFYLHAPEGVGRSKLAAGAEKALGVPMTVRNWRTVGNIREMARELR